MQIIAFPKIMNRSNSIPCSTLVSPENSLKISLARIQKTRSARIIFIAWPNLEEACKKLARIITHACPTGEPGEDGYLLDKALTVAINSYEQVSSTALREEDMANAFTRALFNVGGEVVKTNIHIVCDGETVWWPHYELPLFDFVKKNRATDVFFTPSQDCNDNMLQASRMLMASHICSVKVLAKMGLAPNAVRVVAA